MNFGFDSIYLVHLSNVLTLIAYSVRDALLLRWFAVAAALIIIPFYISQPLWPPVFWASTFICIHICKIAGIYAERRPVVLSEDEQNLYDCAFKVLLKRQFTSLLLIGEWRTAESGETVLREGEPVEFISIAIAGSIQVSKGEKAIGMLKPGHVIGTTLTLIGGSSPIDAQFCEPGRYFRWPLGPLRVFMDRHPELRDALQRGISRDLAIKLDALVRKSVS